MLIDYPTPKLQNADRSVGNKWSDRNGVWRRLQLGAEVLRGPDAANELGLAEAGNLRRGRAAELHHTAAELREALPDAGHRPETPGRTDISSSAAPERPDFQQTAPSHDGEAQAGECGSRTSRTVPARTARVHGPETAATTAKRRADQGGDDQGGDGAETAGAGAPAVLDADERAESRVRHPGAEPEGKALISAGGDAAGQDHAGEPD